MVAGPLINVENQLCFHTVVMNPPKIKVQKIAPFMIASKRITYSGEIQRKE